MVRSRNENAVQAILIFRLEAIEELAGVDVLCADKTGTLTQNKLTLGDPFSVNKIPAAQVILNAALASRADNNDTIDLAVLGGLKDDQVLKTYQVTHFQPFDPVHKRTEATVKGQDGKEVTVLPTAKAGGRRSFRANDRQAVSAKLIPSGFGFERELSKQGL